jgi:uncharacterized protein YbjT (DUF2867 family)
MDRNTRIALVAGATGLIGSQLVSLLLSDERYSQVKALTRRPLSPHPKLQTIQIEMDAIESHADELIANDVFCCLGTTIKKARSREAFKRVDYEYPKRLVALSQKTGARSYHLVSALGANKNSGIFYNRVKGETEEAVTSAGIERVHVYRPSLLLGPRQEQRTGEDAAKIFYKIFGFLIPAKYMAIESVKVARAMVHFADCDDKGVFIHESSELQRF